MTLTIGEPIRLYPGDAPGSESWEHEELEYTSELFATEVVTNVVVPTLTPVVPAERNGTAVIVAPGGGFHALSINSEGYDVAHWLADRGVTAFVLKYRLVPSGPDAVYEMFHKGVEQAASDMAAIGPLAGADGIAAMRLVRERAATLEVDPNRIGFVGFSAGGNVAMQVVYAADPAARPDFVAPIYASLTGIDLVAPPPGASPMFIVAATDDQLGLAEDSVRIYECWRGAGVPAEVHLYATGGHGFGMRIQDLPSDRWIDRFGDWLDSAGLIDGVGRAQPGEKRQTSSSIRR